MVRFYKVLLIGLGALISSLSLAQTVTLSPANPTPNQSVTLTFDATGTSLVGESKVYMHSGLVTTNTATPGSGDWKFVKGNWGKDDGIGLMAAVTGQANKWQIALAPTMLQYYGAPDGTNIFWLALVFRNAAGTKQTSPDIFYKLSTLPFTSITSPSSPEVFYPTGGAITISGSASVQASTMEILVDAGSGFTSIATASNTTTISTSYSPVSASAIIKIKAMINATSVETTSTFTFATRPVVIEENLPPGIKDGINYHEDPTKVTLVLLAPGKEFVYAMGDFTNWQLNDAYFMKKTPDGERFWLEINGLNAGQEYVFQYWVDGAIKVGDPLADKVADPFHDSSIPSATYPSVPVYGKTQYGIATVLQTNQTPYSWSPSEKTWVAPDKKELVIYELLLRDFIGSRRYKDLADSLSYFKRLGINAIELMPIMEFEGNLSWGYNPSYFFAPDKFYGSKNDLKDFIQKAHQQGIAVILDMVLNHAFGQNAMVQMYFDKAAGKPAANNPWFNRDATHPFNVGYDFNHESQYTKDFVDTVCSYWLKEYHFDGFRFDLSKGFTQKNNPNDLGAWSAYDGTRINLLTRMANEIWKQKPEAYVILEHLGDPSEEATLANNGMLLWGNMTGTYSSALSGNSNANINPASRVSHVNYMESHDEERQMVELLKNGQSQGSYNIKNLEIALNRAKMGAAFFFTLPGPKMLWQFEELGYDRSINYCSNGTESSNCRLDNKPLPWGTGGLNYYTNTDRQRLYKTIAAINQLVKTNKATFKNGNIETIAIGNMRVITITSTTMDVSIVGNFSTAYQKQSGVFTKTGTWFDYFGNESRNVTDVNETLLLAPGEFHIYTSVQQAAPPSGLVDFVITGIEETVEDSFAIYPNPVKDKTLIIRRTKNHAGPLHVWIMDQLGRVRMSEERSSADGTFRFDVQSLPRGVYIIKAEQGTVSRTQKISIE
jgi:glycosidase